MCAFFPIMMRRFSLLARVAGQWNLFALVTPSPPLIFITTAHFVRAARVSETGLGVRNGKWAFLAENTITSHLALALFEKRRGAPNYISGGGDGMSLFCAQIRPSRDREKKELSDRLANYIEKVRFLEAQNRKLKADLDMLQGRRGKDTITIKTMYESEIQTAKKLIEDTGRSKQELEQDVAKLQRDLDEQRRKYEEAVCSRAGDREKLDDLLVQLSNLDAEISLVKRRIALLEEELSKLRKENSRLQVFECLPYGQPFPPGFISDVKQPAITN